MAQLQKHREKALKEALAAARELSQQRKAAAQSLEKQILTELQELNMGSIRFQVAFAEKKLDATGMDEVRFLMSANVGEELRPIQKIASGGELARIMLAMKNVFSQQEKLGREDGKDFPPKAGAVCDASSAAGSYGGYSFFCRKGRFRRPDFYPCTGADTAAAPGGAGPAYRQRADFSDYDRQC